MTSRRRQELTASAAHLAITRDACERAIRELREVGGDAQDAAQLLDLVRAELDVLHSEVQDELGDWATN